MIVKNSIEEHKEKCVEVMSLGGVDEMGKNCSIIKIDNEIIMIDAGIAFPSQDYNSVGVSMIIPDFKFIEKNINKFKAVFFTHGHEDHIGAIKHLIVALGDKKIPIYCSHFAYELINNKLSKTTLNHNVNFIVIDDRFKVNVSNNFSVEYFRVTHSIPDAFCLSITTPYGIIVHSGDFKFDLTPVDGKTTDFHKLSELGEKNVLLLMCESTNATKEEWTKSESNVGRSLNYHMKEAKGRVVIATFSSHIHRLQQIINIVDKSERKCFIDGKSMLKSLDIAEKAKKIKIPQNCIMNLTDINSLPDEKVVVICTGTQGEFFSTLTRIADGRHKGVKLKKGDTVIISSTPIPGNELSVIRTINYAMKCGAHVIHERNEGIHVSGHGNRQDIRLMLSLVKPKYYMPIHGEYINLYKNKELAMEHGISEENIVIPENGNRYGFNKNGILNLGVVKLNDIMISDAINSSVLQYVIRERIIMSKEGVLMFLLIIDEDKNIKKMHVVFKGFVTNNVNYKEEIFRNIKGVLRENKSSEDENNSLTNAIKNKLLNVMRHYNCNPLIVPIVITI